MDNYYNENEDTETLRIDESTYTERIEDAAEYGAFNIVLDVEIYHSERDLE